VLYHFTRKKSFSLFLNLKLWNSTIICNVNNRWVFSKRPRSPQIAINQSANEVIHFIIFYYGNTDLAANKINIFYFLLRLTLRFSKYLKNVLSVDRIFSCQSSARRSYLEPGGQAFLLGQSC